MEILQDPILTTIFCIVCSILMFTVVLVTAVKLIKTSDERKLIDKSITEVREGVRNSMLNEINVAQIVETNEPDERSVAVGADAKTVWTPIKVKLWDIKYKDNTKYLTVCGPGQLEQFARGLGMNCYDAKSAPKTWTVEVTANPNDLVEIAEEAQRIAEEELGLQIESCRIIY